MDIISTFILLSHSWRFLHYVQAVTGLLLILLFETQKIQLLLQSDIFVKHMIIHLLLLTQLFTQFKHLLSQLFRLFYLFLCYFFKQTVLLLCIIFVCVRLLECILLERVFFEFDYLLQLYYFFLVFLALCLPTMDTWSIDHHLVSNIWHFN